MNTVDQDRLKRILNDFGATEAERFSALADLYFAANQLNKAKIYRESAAGTSTKTYQTGILYLALEYARVGTNGLNSDPVFISKAAEHFKSISKMMPIAKYYLGTLCETVEAYDESIRYFEEYLTAESKTTAPDNTIAKIVTHLSLFRLYHAKQRYLEAIMHLASAWDMFESKVSNFKNKDLLIHQINKTLEFMKTHAEIDSQISDTFQQHYRDSIHLRLQQFAAKLALKPVEYIKKPKTQTEQRFATQNQITSQIYNLFLPILEKLGRDSATLDAIKKDAHGILLLGACFTLSFLWLFSMRVNNIAQTISDPKKRDDLMAFQNYLFLTVDTNLIEILLKLDSNKPLSKNDEKIISDIERFVQHLLFHHGTPILEGVFGQNPFPTGESRYQSVQFELMTIFFESTSEDRIHEHAEIQLNQISESRFDSFVIIINDIHTIAVARTPDKIGKFLLYEPYGFADAGNNPREFNEEQLHSCIAELENIYDVWGPTKVYGFNFSSPRLSLRLF